MPKTFPLNSLEQRDEFVARHIGPAPEDVADMLAAIGATSLAALIDATIPAAIPFRIDMYSSPFVLD